MNNLIKKNLCYTCAKLLGINSDGYIKCPEFTTYQAAKEEGMTVFLHCFCLEHEDRKEVRV